MAKILNFLTIATGASLALSSFSLAGEPQWYSWRGPNQNGTSDETYKNWSFNEEPLWVYDKIMGRGTPTVADGNLYDFGYRGTGPDFEETLTCLDAKTGELKWEIEVNDYISDTIYNRYGIGAPTVDPETGNIYLSTTNGHFLCASKEGKILWEHSMIERFGRLTFPNGRTGSILVDSGLAVIHCVTSYWGAEGPARDRFYAFDKMTGEPVWSSTPGTAPQDSSFSTPVLATVDGKRVFYAGTGCGNIVCVNMNTGAGIWRWRVCQGGVNASPVIFDGKLISLHGAENLDTSDVGRMFAMTLPTELDNVVGEIDAVEGGGPNLPNSVEAWRNDIDAFTSSPTLMGNRVYVLNAVGELNCVNAETGELVWAEKLGPDNIHASPLAVDGKLIVPIHEGTVYIIEPSDKGPKILHKLKLNGICLGQPTVWNGHLYVQAEKGLYCWKFGADSMETPDWPAADCLRQVRQNHWRRFLRMY
jgi:outer membrane protein assembly factor BamB